jgi:hypothetical protein
MLVTLAILTCDITKDVIIIGGGSRESDQEGMMDPSEDQSVGAPCAAFPCL